MNGCDIAGAGSHSGEEWVSQVFGSGRLLRLEERLELVVLRGSWREMGRQYGGLLRTELRRTLEWADRRGDARSDAFFSPQGNISGMDFMDAFCAGAAEASGLTMPELIRANGVEVAYGGELDRALARGGRCATLALHPGRTADGKLLMARNYDWLPDFAGLDLVVAALHPADGMAMLSVNFAGCFYLTTGMNEGGLFVELNSGTFAGDAARPDRRQNAWTLWEVLRKEDSADGAAAALDGFPAAECYLIGLADARKAVDYEWAVERPSAVVGLEPDPGWLAFTNHFRQPDWRNLPSADSGDAISSAARLRALQGLAGGLPEKASLEDLQDLVGVEVGRGGAKWRGTLFQVVAVPADRCLLLRRRDSSRWLRISLDGDVGPA